MAQSFRGIPRVRARPADDCGSARRSDSLPGLSARRGRLDAAVPRPSYRDVASCRKESWVNLSVANLRRAVAAAAVVLLSASWSLPTRAQTETPSPPAADSTATPAAADSAATPAAPATPAPT